MTSTNTTTTAIATDSQSPGAASKDKDNKTIQLNDKTVKEEEPVNKLTSELRSLEERRRSLLDHHWAVPSKDKQSLEDEEESQQQTAATTTTSMKSQDQPIILHPTKNEDEISQLTKLSCHDSGIDIRDPATTTIILPIVKKKVYSDADIVLSSEWVPPLTIAATHLTDTSTKITPSGHAALIQQHNLEQGGRKKTSSVSFSVDDNMVDHQNNGTIAGGGDKVNDTKKNKVCV